MMAGFQIISQMKPASNVKEKQDNEAFKNLQPKNRFDILYKKGLLREHQKDTILKLFPLKYNIYNGI